MSHQAGLFALAATLAIATAALLVATHNPIVPRQPPATAHRAPSEPSARTHMPRPAPRAGDPVLAVARAYALAARNWTATSYHAAWRRQLALSTGPLRRRLRATPPTRVLEAALRVDRAASIAVVVRARRDPATRAPAARVVIWLDERSEMAGRVLGGQTRNALRLRRTRRGWRVSGFTFDPAGVAR